MPDFIVYDSGKMNFDKYVVGTLNFFLFHICILLEQKVKECVITPKTALIVWCESWHICFIDNTGISCFTYYCWKLNNPNKPNVARKNHLAVPSSQSNLICHLQIAYINSNNLISPNSNTNTEWKEARTLDVCSKTRTTIMSCPRTHL